MRQIPYEFKYMPKSFDEMIVAEELRPVLKKSLEELPNMIFSGPPGTGKGTFIDVLKSTHPDIDILKINCSDYTSIDDVRDKVKPFAQAIGFGALKIVFLNECLEENELIRTSETESIRIGDIQYGESVSVLSFNMDTGEVEQDSATKIKDSLDEVFEVELEDGRTIKTNKEHPFLVMSKGNIVEKKLKDLEEDDEIVTI